MKDYKKYMPNFSEGKLWKKISLHASRLGQQTLYSALLLYYAFKRKETPLWAKNIVIGVLGYLISPFDFIPDLTPIIGFTDDASVLAFGLVTIACYVNDGVRAEARKKLSTWFTNINDSSLSEVDAKL